VGQATARMEAAVRALLPQELVEATT